MTNTGLPVSAADERPPTPSGWLLFSALMILWAGIWNIFQAFTGFFRPDLFSNHTVGGPIWLWSILWILFGVLQLAASGAIMTHRSWGRWFGIVTVGLAAFVNMLTVGTQPWWSTVLIVLEILVVFSLAVKWRSPGGAAN
jgi:hypothetical protein